MDRPEIAALSGFYHMHMNGDPIDKLAEIVGQIKHVHLPVPTLPGLIDNELTIDHPTYRRSLKSGGYDGRISVEDKGKGKLHGLRPTSPARSQISQTDVGIPLIGTVEDGNHKRVPSRRTKISTSLIEGATRWSTTLVDRIVSAPFEHAAIEAVADARPYALRKCAS